VAGHLAHTGEARPGSALPDRRRPAPGGVGGGLLAKGGGPLVGFALAGADRRWAWADAQIDRDQVILASASVPKPTHVRYAWAKNPRFSLFNKDGLPASPFEAAVP
jgi:sialate O-acetylesterase